MKRTDWMSALEAWARRRLGQPYEWGRTDCVMIALEAFDVMTGHALAEQYRGRYSTRGQAARFQRRRIDLPAALERAGARRVVGSPQIGDLVIAEKEGFRCGHAVLGRYALSAWPETGVSLCEAGELMALPGSYAMRLP